MLSRSQVAVLLTVWLGVFLNYSVYSVIAPFFPLIAKKKGITGGGGGLSLVFASYSLAQITASFLAGRNLNKIGAKTVVVTGLAITGSATIIFGGIETIDDVPLFLATCAAIRFIEGAGFAAFFTSALTVVVETFPADPGYYVGLTESIVTLGMMMGPPMGSSLYTAGGFPLPLVTFGIALLVICIISTFTIPSLATAKSSNEQPITIAEYTAVLKLPETILAVACTALNVATDVFVLINLEDHLRTFDLTMVQVGFVYLCLFLSYGFSSPAAGKLGDKTDHELLLQSIGCLCISAAFMLMAPVILLSEARVAAIVAGLLLKGLGAGPLISCSYTACLKAARDSAGRSEDSRTYTLVSTIVTFSIPVGNLVGGIAAPIMYDELGIKISSSIFIIVFTVIASACAYFDYVATIRRRRTKTISKCDLNYVLLRSEPSADEKYVIDPQQYQSLV